MLYVLLVVGLVGWLGAGGLALRASDIGAALLAYGVVLAGLAAFLNSEDRSHLRALLRRIRPAA